VLLPSAAGRRFPQGGGPEQRPRRAGREKKFHETKISRGTRFGAKDPPWGVADREESGATLTGKLSGGKVAGARGGRVG